MWRRTRPSPIPSHIPPTLVPLPMAQYTPEYIRAFQNVVTKTKSFAAVAAKQKAPTFQDQKATGRSKGCSRALSQTVTATQRSTGQTKGVQKATVNSDTPIVRGVLTTMIRGAVMETPIITMQQNKGVALYQVTQGAQMKAATYREDLRQKLSRTESVTSRIQRIPSPSPPKAAPKLKYSHVVGSTLRPHDPGKLSPDLSCVRSRDISTTLGSRDIQARDPEKVSHDLPRDWSSTRSQVTT